MPPHDRRSFLAASAAAVAAAALPRVTGADAKPSTPPKFKLGLISYNVAKDWDLPTTLKVCREVGIAAVECRTSHKHGVEITLKPAERAAVRKQFADSGIVFWGSGSTCEFHAADPAVVKKNVEECKQFVKLVADLGGKGVKVRPNGVPKGGDPAKTFAQIGRALKECGQAAADAGLEIWVEVHGAVTQLPRNMRTILDACGHPAVGAAWNSNPTDLTAGTLDESFDLLKGYIKHCHINDLVNDAAGKYPYRDLFRRLKGIDYDRYTMCEVAKSYDVPAGTDFLKGYKKLWEELAGG